MKGVVERPGMGASPIPSAKGEKRETEETSEAIGEKSRELTGVRSGLQKCKTGWQPVLLCPATRTGWQPISLNPVVPETFQHVLPPLAAALPAIHRAASLSEVLHRRRSPWQLRFVALPEQGQGRDASGGLRTHTNETIAHQGLSLARIPIPPRWHGLRL